MSTSSNGSGRCFPSIFVLLLFVGLALYYGGAVWNLAGAGGVAGGASSEVSPFFVKIMRGDASDEDLAKHSKAAPPAASESNVTIKDSTIRRGSRAE
jgi:hypothetical protein